MDPDSFAFFPNDDLEEDKETIEKCFFYTKQIEANEEKELHNITSFIESDKMVSGEKKEDKTNDDLNETSMTIKIDDYDNDDSNGDNYNDIDSEKIQSSNKIFMIFKKKKNLKKRKRSQKSKRKFDADTIRRKIKPNYHKYIFDTLNQCIKSKKIKIKNQHLQLLKMNNFVTSTVSIEFNKELLNKTIGTIIETEPISSKYKVYDKENNSHLINLLRSINDDEINGILNQSYIEMYYDYLQSNSYKCSLKKIKNKDGEEYLNKFISISNDFIYYFLFTEPKNEKIQMINSNKQNMFPCSRDTSFNSVCDIVLNSNDNDEQNGVYDIYSNQYDNKLDQSNDKDILMMLDLD